LDKEKEAPAKQDKQDGIDYKYVEARHVSQVEDVSTAVPELPVEMAKVKLQTWVDKVILYDAEDIEIILR